MSQLKSNVLVHPAMHGILLNVTGKLSSHLAETTHDLSYRGQLVNAV